MYNEVVKNTKFNTLKTKINSLEKKISDATTLIYIDQYKTDKKTYKKTKIKIKVGILIQNIRYKWFSAYYCF